MRIILIRHFLTKGNLEKRYIGRSDESLLDSGIKNIHEEIKYPDTGLVYSSPLKRCIQTARLIYGTDREIRTNDSLSEMDFGDFEGKNYEELKDIEEYRLFIDSGGVRQIPNGENAESFKKRSCDGFLQVVEDVLTEKSESAAIVCHGGTIMSIMEHFDPDKKSFYTYMVKNGCGYILEYDTKTSVFVKTDKLM